MNDHDISKETLALAAAAALDAPELRRVQQHVEACEVCRRELAMLTAYAAGLRRLPQPRVPLGLVERTQARVLREQADASERSRHGLAVSFVAIFAWITSLASWLLLRLLIGETVSVALWLAASTGLIWTTAGTAGLMLRTKRNAGRLL